MNKSINQWNIKKDFGLLIEELVNKFLNGCVD